MKFVSIPLAGAYVIELDKREDERGFFARRFCEREFAEAGLETRFVQINNSLSRDRGTLRGMHYQLGDAAEVQLVRCVKGALWDAIADLRPGSAGFGRSLVAAGHHVVAAYRGRGQYEGVRAERVRMVRELCETRFGCAVGADAFLDLVRAAPGGFDVLCHHGAEVGDYRSPDFDPYRAAALNLHRLPEVLRALKDRGCGRLVLTGSVFEQNEGAGSEPLRAFSPYGLSKGLTAAAAAFYADREGLTFEKFVIPNPFGPYEEPRFTAYLIKTWLAGETARVPTPRQ